MLEGLCITHYRAIGEGDLFKLGPTWHKIKRLRFKIDANNRYRNVKITDKLDVDRWQKKLVPCDNMLELYLGNCIIITGRGLACILGKCKNLENIHLDMCNGARDFDIMGLARTSRNFWSISLRVASDFAGHLSLNNPLRLTDVSLRALAQNCPKLETFKISVVNGDFPSLSPFSWDAILLILKLCPIRELYLDQMHSFDDDGMEALCSVENLERLELVRCQQITDEGLIFVDQYPSLRVLRLNKCLGITDEG